MLNVRPRSYDLNLLLFFQCSGMIWLGCKVIDGDLFKRRGGDGGD